jgi:hypothetical protein
MYKTIIVTVIFKNENKKEEMLKGLENHFGSCQCIEEDGLLMFTDDGKSRFYRKHQAPHSLPNAYKHSRGCTQITVKRFGSDDWRLTNIAAVTSWEDAFKADLILTEQDPTAIEIIRRSYSAKGGVSKSIADQALTMSYLAPSQDFVIHCAGTDKEHTHPLSSREAIRSNLR